MNKLLALVLVVGAIVGFYLLRDRSATIDNTDSSTNATSSAPSSFRPDPSSATFTFDDGPVTLSRGKIERPIAQGSSFIEEIVLTDKVAYGDINGDQKEDAAILILRSGGGSGSFIYVAAMVSGPVNYRGSNAVFIGDRIMPDTITVEGARIKVTYLDRRSDEPMAAQPTVPVTKEYIYRSGNLEEI
jgi:hypothetical protein